MIEKLLFFVNVFAKFASSEFKAIISALDSALQEDNEDEFRAKLRKTEHLFSDAVVSLPNHSNKRAALMAAAAVIDNIRNGTIARFDQNGKPRIMIITIDEAKEQINQVRNGLLTRIFKPDEEFKIDEVGKINMPDKSRDEFTFDMTNKEISWFQSNYKSALFKRAEREEKRGSCKKCGKAFKLTSSGLIPYHDSKEGNPNCPGSQDGPRK